MFFFVFLNLILLNFFFFLNFILLNFFFFLNFILLNVFFLFYFRYLRICSTWNQQSDLVVTWNVILRELSAANRRRRRDPS